MYLPPRKCNHNWPGRLAGLGEPWLGCGTISLYESQGSGASTAPPNSPAQGGHKGTPLPSPHPAWPICPCQPAQSPGVWPWPCLGQRWCPELGALSLCPLPGSARNWISSCSAQPSGKLCFCYGWLRISWTGSLNKMAINFNLSGLWGPDVIKI